MRYWKLDIHKIATDFKIYVYDRRHFRDRNITASIIAKELGISRTLLSHAVNHEIGMTINEFINEQRIKYIDKLAASNENRMPLEQIILLSGFSCTSTYYRYIKKKMMKEEDNFNYSGERFADLQMLRYKLPGFKELSPRQKEYIYYLSEATLWGRDITFDQFGKYNLLIRKALEAVYTIRYAHTPESSLSDEQEAVIVYLKRVWFSSGIYHHYSCDKFKPGFSQAFFENEIRSVGDDVLPMPADELLKTICPVMFNETVLPKRVNQTAGDDLVRTSACNYYEGVSQQEAEEYYTSLKGDTPTPPSYGLNSSLIKRNGKLTEEKWFLHGKYSKTISKIIHFLDKARSVAENDQQKTVISLLIKYYETGDLSIFDDYCIEWLKELDGRIDFINGFIEVYGDPLGFKASWEGIVEYKDLQACKRTKTISDNAQWFEDHSPVDPRFKKPKVKGVVANAVCGAMLGGDEYPSTAIGINLPNADWIRAQYGSKSVTISNFTAAYIKASRGSGFLEEYAIDQETINMIRKYGDVCDDLHTDLHECLGHGSGQILPGVSTDALKSYMSTIEEARADLFGLYYIADEKMVELGLVPDNEAYKSNYYTYIMNGMLTQCVRIKLGCNVEEAHMRNRALIANWCYTHSDGNIEIIKRNGKSFIKINDFELLRSCFGILLAEIQRIKSEGDYEAAKALVETYGVRLDPELHREVLERYKALNVAPYKGFLNPKMTPVYNDDGSFKDIELDYSETLTEQMLRYSHDYSLEC